jgi:hypothetical protein
MADIVLFKQIIKAFEGIAAIAGFINWGKWKHSYWKWFPIYLIVLFFTECTGHLLAHFNLREANANLYNYFGLPLEFLFYCWFYYRCFNKNMKPLPVFCAAAFIISWIIEQVFIKERSAYFSSFSYCIGNIVIVIMIIAFILKFSLSQEVLDYKTNPVFWVTIGLMIFYLGTFPYYGLFNLLAKKHRPIHEMYTWAMIFLNYTMYLIFASIFIWSKPK